MKTGYSNMRCGLIGRKLSHSFSKPIHNALCDYDFAMCELEPDELEDFVKNGPLDAFCITIPYKKDVIPFLDEISQKAQTIGAVNTVVRKNGKLYGYNTDYFGLEYTVRRSGVSIEGKKVLVFGRGGAAATVCAYLSDVNASEVICLGSADNTPENLALHYDAEIIINASPVGMYPNNDSSPAPLGIFPKCEAVFDLIYNPADTRIMLEAKEKGIVAQNGLNMLVSQAARAFELFTSDAYEDGIIERIVSDISFNSLNLVLVGMPSCGKSTVGAIAAEILERDFIDSDTEFEKQHGITPANAIKTLGEEKFRLMETETLSALGKLRGKVIATGGGAVTKERNYPLLKQNGVIIFLERDLDKLSATGRPISQSTSIEELYVKRKDAYCRFADITVKSTEVKENTASLIVEAFKNHFKG